MKSCSSIEIRRARPLLGTVVEIAARGRKVADLERGIEAAFAAVAKVHRLMSFHDPQSDVSLINRGAFPKGVTVHPWTWNVLKAAREFARESNGAFDITVAALLAGWSYLPRYGYRVDATGSAADIFLRKHWEVFFRRRLVVDLGGIAKGFAVDRAVEALRGAGVISGIVNAGGDLRVFGPTPRRVDIRHPALATLAAGICKLRNRAVATSGLYFSRRRRGSSLVDGRRRRALVDSISVTVAASECMTADALTKVVFALQERAAPILDRYHADAILLERDGSPCWMFRPPCDTRDRAQFD
jgi:thiamine biosynthesis lipoprotein